MGRLRLPIALGASAAIVLSTPYIGQARAAVQDAFPAHYRTIVAGLIAAAGLAAAAAALRRIRDRHAWRYGALAAALAVALTYAAATRTGEIDRDLVERFHFVEYGVLTLLFYRAWRDRADASALLLPVCWTAIAGIADEAFQWFVPSRVGELRDVLLNTAAIVCGLLFSLGIDPPPRFSLRCSPGCRRAVAGSLAALLVAAAAFLDAVHLGHEIRSAGAGSFPSAFDEAALRAAAADRAGRWARSAPVVAEGIAREDHYLSEGRLHVQHRNDADRAGDAWVAWHENAILERFYGPVLDHALPGSRWPPERRDAIARTASDPRPYRSAALPYPIFVLDRRVLWLFTAAAAALLVAAGRWPGRVRRVEARV